MLARIGKIVKTEKTVLIGCCLLIVAASSLPGQEEPAAVGGSEETMTQEARGTFDIRMSPLEPYNQAEDAALGRMSIDKEFHGDLEATSQGEMLSAGAPQAGSAGYVAIERVTGTLGGRQGSFVLQHNGTIHAGDSELTVTVVPSSSTGEFEGLTGSMTITIKDGQHFYEFVYTLAGES